MLAQIITENGQKKVIPLTADAGAGLPVGFIAPAYKKGNYSGWLYLDGRDTTGTSEELSTHYPILYAILGSNKLPDYREFALVGAEENTTDVYNASTNPTGTIHDHDVYTEGQAKDDQFQKHEHKVLSNQGSAGGAGGGVQASSTPGNFWTQEVNGTGQRSGTVTRGKRKAVYFYIKATSGLSENAQDNVINTLNEERSYSTSEVNTGKKWIDGKNIYKKTVVIDNGGAVLAEDGSYEKSLGVANVDTVISLTGISKAGNQYIVIAGTDATIAGVYTVRPAYDISSGKVIAHIKGYANITEIIVTVEYTKTTD